MRYNSYINNVKSKEWGLNIQQAYLFSWFYELPSWAEKVLIGSDVYWFASKNKAIKELPLLTDKRDTIYRYYKQLESLKLIKIKKIEGKDYIMLTDKAKTWNGGKSERSEINPSKTENNSEINPTNNVYNNNINNVSQSETTYKNENIINLDRDETLKQIDNDDEKLQFRIAKSLNTFFVKYCKKHGIKVKSHISKAKASKEMWSIKQLLKDYSEADVRKVIKWLYDGKGNADFWQKQIQSASGFREKFEKMKLAMIENKKQDKRL